jgi:hypothetical protein
MTVSAGWFGGKLWVALPGLSELPPALQREVLLGAALNSKARLLRLCPAEAGVHACNLLSLTAPAVACHADALDFEGPHACSL